MFTCGHVRFSSYDSYKMYTHSAVRSLTALGQSDWEEVSLKDGPEILPNSIAGAKIGLWLYMQIGICLQEVDLQPGWRPKWKEKKPYPTGNSINRLEMARKHHCNKENWIHGYCLE